MRRRGLIYPVSSESMAGVYPYVRAVCGSVSCFRMTRIETDQVVPQIWLYKLEVLLVFEHRHMLRNKSHAQVALAISRRPGTWLSGTTRRSTLGRPSTTEQTAAGT